MFKRKWIEELDAAGRIYRKANEQYLPAFQAFWAMMTDLSQGFLLAGFGCLNAGMVILAGHFLGIFGFLWLAAFAFASLCVFAAVFDAYSLVFPYYQYWMRTSHGSARWATLDDLKVHRLLRTRGEPMPKGALRIGRVFGNYDLVLPQDLWLLHLVFFGPTGAGKTKTFFMSMLRYLAAHGSTIAFDPKGELYEQTAMDYRVYYRLDLINPATSDRWNFLPQCRQNAFLANSLAGMMLSLESRAKTNQDPFWGNAEQVLLTAVLLHLAESYPLATPAFAYDFVAELDSIKKSDRIKELQTSPSGMARQAMQVVENSAPENTLGSVLLGLASKLRPFTLDEARQVMAMPSHAELLEGIKLIDFSDLRKPGTAVFLVVPEGATEVYKEFLATFFGQAIFELRLDNMREPEHPCLVLIDEARELDVAEVRRIAGIGRGRGIGMALSYQDYPQVLDQYGDKGAKAILETMMTKIFLPGVNGETANYASDLLGKTTIHTETSVDYQGTDRDNMRYAETGRALVMPDEIRQMPKYQQLLVVTDTAPPIKAAFPPIYLRRDTQQPIAYRKPDVLRLGDSKVFDNSFPATAIRSGIKTKLQTPVTNQINRNALLVKDERGKANVSDFASGEQRESEFDDNLSQIVDAALSEIGEQIEIRAEEILSQSSKSESQDFLVLVDCEDSLQNAEDFMKQPLVRVFADDAGRTDLINANTETGDEAATDCFDTEVSVREKSESANEETIGQEVSLINSYVLNRRELKGEQAAQSAAATELNFADSIVQRIL